MVLIIVPCTVVEQMDTEESQGKGDKKDREWRLPQMLFSVASGMRGWRRLPVNLYRQERTRGILLQLRSGLWALFRCSRLTVDKSRWRKVQGAKGRWIGSRQMVPTSCGWLRGTPQRAALRCFDAR